ncbi:hypothetical protein AVEN_215206-1 [Araneus ventricosus]|uniref:Uncharacterized protein n=1 Tax=Araneus ventricosus TaxID=182803 RepID=A0A4Y2SID3_ARAVE|nr:hypothetical protein AVEN_215206-1 [Araneus ventricosus]
MRPHGCPLWEIWPCSPWRLHFLKGPLWSRFQGQVPDSKPDSIEDPPSMWACCIQLTLHTQRGVLGRSGKTSPGHDEGRSEVVGSFEEAEALISLRR